jgi:hypothetical protein
MKKNWFDVSVEGLRALRSSVPKSSLIFELVQNAWDTDATYCKISLTRFDDRRFMLLVEDDDPNGFSDISHAYTLFAESAKKGDATKRGRFNIGEKLVIALCDHVSIKTVGRTVFFEGDGTRKKTSRGTEKGTEFRAILKMTQSEYEEIRAAVFSLQPPIPTSFNGIDVHPLTPIRTVEATLPTVIGEDLRPSKRKTEIQVLVPQIRGSMATGPEPAMIYEMGIPVVESGDKYHYNVMQKVPLTIDRTNVTPAFLREVREAVAEAVIDRIETEDAHATWVREAAASPDASKDLVKKVFDLRFGEDALVFDPSDLEANQRALAAGRTLVTGSQMSREEWSNVRNYGLSVPAGKVYFDHKIETSPDGEPWTPVSEVTRGMLQVAQFAREFAAFALNIRIQVDFVAETTMGIAACYGGRCLKYNVGRLGYAAFENGLTDKLLDLTIHELAHEKASNHLSEEFYDACTMLGAKAAIFALHNPHVYQEAGLH